MTLTIEKRDLFTVPQDYYLCHCISSDFALGAGIAKKFAALGVKDELMKYYNAYVWLGCGQCLYTHATGWAGEYNLVTKKNYWHKPKLEALHEALLSLKRHPNANGKLAMPKIGCGLDNLNWQDVEQLIREVFADTDIEILVCDFKG